MSAPLTPEIEALIAAYERAGAPGADDPAAARIAMRGNLDVIAALLRMVAGLRDAGMDPEEVAETVEAAVGGAFAMFCLHVNHRPLDAIDDLNSFVDGVFDVAVDHLESASSVLSGRLN
ncbi:hypothetical protein [Methylobacterium aquaticum]|uniref:Uncharacterized protein n=1 Tax=Methylobacterium aquaticum TaxID=270351 RepID=A0A0C6FP15_9HYPH|nr:hypothetical protein [Methylobacterium aquaticum]BAQ44350.1 hypothetical protein Maq22A_c04700 [Methylobacterium aquaticum]